jgi:hypothetical protein
MGIMKKNIVLFLLLGIIMACNPEDLEIGDSTPKFRADIEVDGVSKVFEAGNNGFYLKPSYKIKNGVLIFQSEFLKDESCNEQCNEKLKIEIADYQLFEDTNFDVANSISAGTYEYVSPQENSLTSSFLEVINTSISDVPVSTNWEIGEFDFESIFQNIISVEIPELTSLLNIGLNIQGAGCQSTMRKSYSNNSLMNYCDASIKIIKTGEIIAATVVANGVAPFKVSWNNVNPSDTVAGLLVLNENVQGVISATVEDATGCIINVELDMHGAIDQNCQADFSYNILEPLSAVSGLSAIKIEYTDEEGIIFKSEKTVQDPLSKFRIETIEEYIEDEEGNPTKAMDIVFNVLLKSSEGKIIRISEGQANIAVSYPAN